MSIETRSRVLGVALLLALAAHALQKAPGAWLDMLWFCHVATLLLAVGLLLPSMRLAAVGFVSHVAIGFPSYLFDLVFVGGTTLTSVIVHLLPLVAGAWALRRLGFWRPSGLWAAALYAVLMPISYWLTPESLNVNLAHKPWGPFAAHLSTTGSWALNAVMALGLSSLAALGLERAGRGSKASRSS